MPREMHTRTKTRETECSAFLLNTCEWSQNRASSPLILTELPVNIIILILITTNPKLKANRHTQRQGAAEQDLNSDCPKSHSLFTIFFPKRCNGGGEEGALSLRSRKDPETQISFSPLWVLCFHSFIHLWPVPPEKDFRQGWEQSGISSQSLLI